MLFKAGQSASFLLVDDNEAFLTLLEGFVRRFYPESTIVTAITGEQALERLTQDSHDVLLLDYRLPDFDGLEVLGEIRALGLDLAVVMVTGEGDERLDADIFRMGAYDYLVKSSIGEASLRRCLDSVLTRRVLEAQIATKSDELVASSRELSERSRALDTAYGKLRTKKEELRLLSDSLEQTVQERTAELSATTSFLNKVLDSSTDHFIVATDRAGTVLTFNRGAEVAFGAQSSDVVGEQHFRGLFGELADDDEALAGLWREVRDSGSIQRELSGRVGAERSFVAAVTVSLLSGRKGEEGMVILGTDVTHERELERKNQAYIRQIEMANLDLRRKNEQILEATRLKSEFIANVSHELRTPLNAIIGYADLLGGGIYGPMPPKQESAVGGIGARAKDLLALINDILDLAKIEAGRMDLRADDFVLGDLVEEALETGRVLAIDKELEVDWRHEGVEVLMKTDRQKLHQILLNLVNNAVKFTPNGFVRIESVERTPGLIELSVVDSGIGISEENLPRVFDEFRQVDGTSTREYDGTGLGLAICAKLATRLGGELTAVSTVGQGSRFTLVVPATLPGLEDWVDPIENDRVPVTLDPSFSGGWDQPPKQR
jgi:PAS domain S-box-containing protein